MTTTGPEPHPHVGLAERLGALRPGPVFEPVEPGSPEGIVLRAVDALAEENGLAELDVNREPVSGTWGGFASGWHCSVRGADAAGRVTTWCSNWSPVGPHDDPRTGFGDGPDSALLGHFGRAVPPDDWRTEALLLVVTSPFRHLSTDRRSTPAVVQGVLGEGLTGLRYVELLPEGG